MSEKDCVQGPWSKVVLETHRKWWDPSDPPKLSLKVVNLLYTVNGTQAVLLTPDQVRALVHDCQVWLAENDLPPKT